MKAPGYSSPSNSRYRLMYIMITRKSYFIFVLRLHPVSINLSGYHDVPTEKSHEGDASLHIDTYTEDHRAQF